MTTTNAKEKKKESVTEIKKLDFVPK